jgi:N-acetylglucosamine malate deacetylase 1
LKILVIAAHPDDEVLGMGATIKKLSKKNHKIHLCVVSEGASAQYQDKKMIKIRKEACIKAGKILGISQFTFLEFPDAKLDIISQLEINIKLEKIIAKFKPEIVYTTPEHDLMKDHQKVHECTLVATRPTSSTVKQVLCYEIPGMTKNPFNPNVYENIDKEFEIKKKAFKIYKSEVMKYPHPRSIESIENLSIYRGVESGLRKAEAFQLIRHVSDT